MRHSVMILAAIGLMVGASTSGRASLIGAQVTGSLKFGGNPTNYYDPANGYVPSGFLNTAGATVTISDPAVEFGFQDGSNKDAADFTATQLILTDIVSSSAIDWTQTFTSSAFVGLTLTKVSDDFVNGGVTGTLQGDTITMTWAGTQTPGSYTAVFDLTSSAVVPEPGSLALLAGGIPGVLVLAWRRSRPARS